MGSVVSSKTRPRPREHIAFRETSDGGVLINLASGACFRLNRVAADLWTLFSSGETIEAAARTLSSRYGHPLPAIEADALDLTRDLVTSQLVSPHNDEESSR